MLFVEYPTCTTCIRARKWLEAQGAAFTARHIRLERPGYEELKAWYGRSGLPLRRLFNTSGTLYREMRLSEKLPAMPEEEQLRLLATDGMLVKRPILVTDRAVCFGFEETSWRDALSGQV